MAGTAAHKPSTWAVGYTYFAAFVMIAIGGFHVIAGLAGLINDELYVLSEDYVFKFDTTAWGWIHLIAGIVVVLAGVGLFSGAVWARIIGVALAVLSAIVSFAWLPWYPFWSSVIIALDVAVIWALTIHGRDIAAEHESS